MRFKRSMKIEEIFEQLKRVFCRCKGVKSEQIQDTYLKN